MHLHRTRLFRDQEQLQKARALIEHCGYWRRKKNSKTPTKQQRIGATT